VPPSLLEVASSKGFVATSFFTAHPLEHVNLTRPAPSSSRQATVKVVWRCQQRRQGMNPGAPAGRPSAAPYRLRARLALRRSCSGTDSGLPGQARGMVGGDEQRNWSQGRSNFPLGSKRSHPINVWLGRQASIPARVPPHGSGLQLALELVQKAPVGVWRKLLEHAAAVPRSPHKSCALQFGWAKALHSVAAEGISPERAVDEAIARIKQILSE
jgi:hypothetical protein